MSVLFESEVFYSDVLPLSFLVFGSQLAREANVETVSHAVPS